MVLQQVVDDAFEALAFVGFAEFGVQVGIEHLVGDAHAVVVVVDQLEGDGDKFVVGGGGEFTQTYFAQHRRGKAGKGTLALERDHGLADPERVDDGVKAAKGVGVDGEGAFVHEQLVLVVGAFQDDVDVVRADGLHDLLAEGQVLVVNAQRRADEDAKADGLGRLLDDAAQRQQVRVGHFVRVPGAVDDDGVVRSRGTAEHAGRVREHGDGADTGYGHQALGVVAEDVGQVLGVLPAEEVVDLAAVGADRVAVAHDLDRGDAQVAEVAVFVLHADVHEVGQGKVVFQHLGDVELVAVEVDVAHVLEPLAVEYGFGLVVGAQADQGQVVVATQGFDEGGEAAVDGRGAVPAARDDGDAALVGPIVHLGLVHDGFHQLVVHALDAGFLLGGKVGGEEVEVAHGRADVAQLLGRGFDVAGAVFENEFARGAAVEEVVVLDVPEGGEVGAGLEQLVDVKLGFAARVQEGEDFDEIGLLHAQHLQPGVGGLERRHGQQVGDQRVQADEALAVHVAEQVVFLGKEVEKGLEKGRQLALVFRRKAEPGLAGAFLQKAQKVVREFGVLADVVELGGGGGLKGRDDRGCGLVGAGHGVEGAAEGEGVKGAKSGLFA